MYHLLFHKIFRSWIFSKTTSVYTAIESHINEISAVSTLVRKTSY